jgi:RIO kinase 1
VKEIEKFEVFKEVFDIPTMKTIYKLANDGFIDTMMGIVSTGKEANVFLGKSTSGESIAIKVYRMETSNFQHMYKYIVGDRRFSEIKHNKMDIVITWARKEFKNLELAYNAGVRVPKPIICRRNVLVMEFIGESDNSAPIAKNCPPKEPKLWLQKVLNTIKDLYQKAGLIHGDLSEYNILNYDEEPVFIDMGQAVLTDSPLAEELLRNDIKNMLKWFKKLGVKTPEADNVYIMVRSKKADGNIETNA